MISMKSIIATAALALSMTAAISEAGTIKIKSLGDGEIFHAQFSDTKMRVPSPEENGWVLFDQGRIYAVATDGDTPRVIDLTAMAGMTGGVQGLQMFSGVDMSGDNISFKDLKRTETIAGIEGHVYQVTVVEDDGSKSQTEAVFTDSKVVKSAFDHLMKALSAVDNATEQTWQKLGKDQLGNRTGMLRYGNQWQIESIDDKAVDAKLFELPAKPMSMQDMMREAMKGMAN